MTHVLFKGGAMPIRYMAFGGSPQQLHTCWYLVGLETESFHVLMVGDFCRRRGMYMGCVDDVEA